uniref:Uncharacterized protein n=1 Tax=Cacopsylla melanoneura TaxID=428564 RepID=A0A8D8WWE1_9HEMI
MPRGRCGLCMTMGPRKCFCESSRLDYGLVQKYIAFFLKNNSILFCSCLKCTFEGLFKDLERTLMKLKLRHENFVFTTKMMLSIPICQFFQIKKKKLTLNNSSITS